MNVPSEVTTTGGYAGSTGLKTNGRAPNVVGFVGLSAPPLKLLCQGRRLCRQP